MIRAAETKQHMQCAQEKHVHRLKVALVTGLVLTLVPVALTSVARADQVEPQRSVTIQLYVRPGSEPCQQAEQFLKRLQSERRGLETAVHDVIEDQSALSRLWSISRQAGHDQAKLPTFHLVNRLVVGFDDATSGEQVRRLLHIDVYIRPGCRHCHAARSFLDRMNDSGGSP